MIAVTSAEKLLTGPGIAEWPVWSTTARIVVTDPAALPAARALVDARLSEVDAACSRFRPDSELMTLPVDRPVPVSALLAELVGVALDAARRTGGDVDPTIGSALVALGYDRDIRELMPAVATPSGVSVGITPAPGWRRITLRGNELTVPDGIVLDLGATSKAHTADWCANAVADRLGTGALVSLGGDIATAGAAPDGGWRIVVADQPGDPSCRVTIPAGAALATSSTGSRTWRRGKRLLHHVLDPRTCQPTRRFWRSITVAADTCLDANTITTAALVRGPAAPNWLRALGVPARLVGDGGAVFTLNGWPEEAQ